MLDEKDSTEFDYTREHFLHSVVRHDELLYVRLDAGIEYSRFKLVWAPAQNDAQDD